MASVDSVAENRQFAEQEQADFPILSDPDKRVAAAYGVLGPTGLPRRWTFYIGPDRRILAIDKAISTGRAGQDLANRLQELGVNRRGD
jgi:thioredoxin-dependent peroxiredoxin